MSGKFFRICTNPCSTSIIFVNYRRINITKIILKNIEKILKIQLNYMTKVYSILSSNSRARLNTCYNELILIIFSFDKMIGFLRMLKPDQHNIKHYLNQKSKQRKEIPSNVATKKNTQLLTITPISPIKHQILIILDVLIIYSNFQENKYCFCCQINTDYENTRTTNRNINKKHIKNLSYNEIDYSFSTFGSFSNTISRKYYSNICNKAALNNINFYHQIVNLMICYEFYSLNESFFYIIMKFFLLFKKYINIFYYFFMKTVFKMCMTYQIYLSQIAELSINNIKNNYIKEKIRNTIEKNYMYKYEIKRSDIKQKKILIRFKHIFRIKIYDNIFLFTKSKLFSSGFTKIRKKRRFIKNYNLLVKSLLILKTVLINYKKCLSMHILNNQHRSKFVLQKENIYRFNKGIITSLYGIALDKQNEKAVDPTIIRGYNYLPNLNLKGMVLYRSKHITKVHMLKIKRIYALFKYSPKTKVLYNHKHNLAGSFVYSLLLDLKQKEETIDQSYSLHKINIAYYVKKIINKNFYYCILNS
uniref:Uncharacterized protein n=1 Tax=Amorphochlora amoebiformis TaxID=1561963 RepID=A0A0H5BLM1_9EUKA|nr:hypothetical protein [Amorphochlora amoebiformis]